MQFGTVHIGNDIPVHGLQEEVRFEKDPLSFQMTESPIKIYLLELFLRSAWVTFELMLKT